jgi:hypothetical protein
MGSVKLRVTKIRVCNSKNYAYLAKGQIRLATWKNAKPTWPTTNKEM